jgi:hypothetical protein
MADTHNMMCGRWEKMYTIMFMIPIISIVSLNIISAAFPAACIGTL